MTDDKKNIPDAGNVDGPQGRGNAEAIKIDSLIKSLDKSGAIKSIKKNPPFVRTADFGPSGETRTPGILLPKQARYQLRYTRLLIFLNVVKYVVNADF